MKKDKTKKEIKPETTDYIENIPISLIFKSPTNPRKYFNEKDIKELSNSIEQLGLQQPIKVRPVEIKGSLKYEIVFGERRYRAVQLLKKQTIPCIVQKLTDQQVIEIQTIENLQRVDIHPLDEAEGFKLLRKTYNIEQIAAKISKSVDYVYKRIRLTDLIDEFKKAMYDKDFPISVALFICGYHSEIQKSIYKDIIKDNRNLEHNLLPGISELKKYISSNFSSNLDLVCFNGEDKTLNPDRNVACSECSYNTSKDLMLFGETIDARCLNSACYFSKIINDINRKLLADANLKPIADEYHLGSLPQIILKNVKNILSNEHYSKRKAGCKSQGYKGVYVYYNKWNKTKAGSIISICLDKNCRVCTGRTSNPATPSKSKTEVKKAQQYNLERKDRMLILNNARKEIAVKTVKKVISTKNFEKDFIITAILTKNYDSLDFYQFSIFEQLTTIPEFFKKPQNTNYERFGLKTDDLHKLNLDQLYILFFVNYLSKFYLEKYQDYERYKSDLNNEKRDRLYFYAVKYLGKKTVETIYKSYEPAEDKKSKSKSKNADKNKK